MTLLPVSHFYHCFAQGEWDIPVAEHLYALTEAEWDGPITVGLVGPKPRRDLVASVFRAVYPQARFIHAATGYEHVTLNAVRKHVKHDDGLVMYAHTKGASKQSGLAPAWRQSMTERIVSHWRDNQRVLSGEWVDAVGCHWLVPDVCHWLKPEHASPIFAGNFWMARSDYLRRLPALGSHRHDAENWIGLGRPCVADLQPGVPSGETCRPPVRIGRLRVEVGGSLHPDV
jgi:hypothetical protein